MTTTRGTPDVFWVGDEALSFHQEFWIILVRITLDMKMIDVFCFVRGGGG